MSNFEAPTKNEDREEAMLLHGQINVSKRLFSFADSVVLKCAVELRIADVIHSNNGHPMTLSQIASAINSPSINLGYLQRIMRMLIRMGIFTSARADSGETLYGLTPSSSALLHGAELSLAPFLLMQSHPVLLSTWQHLSDSVREGVSAFKKAHGCEVFEMAAADPEFNRIFNDAMLSFPKIFVKGIISTYRDGFMNGVRSVVDVGGGVGFLAAEIVREFPHVKGFNFDLPHVIATAPEYEGVTHVAGDMFKEVPSADVILMKSVMHNWDDEDCIKILKNCRKAIKKANNNGRILIVDVVIRADGEDEGVSGNLDVILDLIMMANCVGGKERTEMEWKNILELAGFPRYNIMNLPFLQSIIEAYPDEQ